MRVFSFKPTSLLSLNSKLIVSFDDIGLSILGSLKDDLSENFTEDDLKAFEEVMRLGEKLMDSLPELQIDN